MRLRAALAAMLLSGVATACTAIVAGGLSSTNDLPVRDGSSSSTGPKDPCALAETDADVNACSTCIETECKEHVAYACNDGKNKKNWFPYLKSCAENPYVSFGPPGSYSYACTRYANPDAAPIASEDDSAKERDSELCVRDKCVTGATPPCRLCPVFIEKPGSGSERAALADDPCGACLVDKCNDIIVRCCRNEVIGKYVARCAYTADNDNRAECSNLTVLPDAGGPEHDAATAEQRCNYDIRACYQTQCGSECPR